MIERRNKKGVIKGIKEQHRIRLSRVHLPVNWDKDKNEKRKMFSNSFNFYLSMFSQSLKGDFIFFYLALYESIGSFIHMALAVLRVSNSFLYFLKYLT